MKKKLLFMTIGIIFFINLFISSVHSEEKLINVYLNNKEINEETILHNYDQEVSIEIKTNQEEIFSTMHVVVMQEKKIMDVPINVNKELQTISFKLPQGKHYTFQIKATHNNEERVWSYRKEFHILKEVPISINEIPLKNNQVIKQNGILKINDFSTLQMDTSFILIDEQKVYWKKTLSGYEYEIDDLGKHELEFHFFDLDNNEIVKESILIIENESIKADYFIDDEILNTDVTTINKDTNVVIHSEVVEPKNLILYLNDNAVDVTWKLKGDLYETSISLQEENSYRLQLFYDDGNRVLLNEKMFILDKTKPVVQIETEGKEIYQDKIMIDIYVKDIHFSMDSYIQEWYENEEKKYQTWVKKDDGYHMQIILQKEGIHTLQFHCFDIANNSAEVYENQQLIDNERLYKIDDTSPLINSNLNNFMNPINKDKQTIQFIVEDENLNMDSIQLFINQKQQAYIIKKDTKLRQAIVEFTLKDEGIHEIQVTASDYANNKTESMLYHVQLDRTMPYLTVQNLHKKISNQDVLFMIGGQDEAILEYNLIIFRDEIKDRVLTYKSNFNEMITFHEDNGTHTYRIELYGKDQAGNENKRVNSFVIDKEAPNIQALFQDTPYRNSILTNESSNILFSWDDLNIDKAEFILYKNGELFNEGTINESFFSKRIQALDNHKDTYVYYLRVFDIAGNISESKMDITLDTYLPSVEIQNEFHKQVFNQPWVPNLTKIQKEVQINDVTLLKNKKEIPYIWGTPIEEDGDYQLQVIIQDLAGNIDAVKPLYFEIDKTPPAIQLLNKHTKKEILQEYEGEPFTLQIDTGFLRKDKLVSIQLDTHELLSEELVAFDVNLKEGNHNLKVTAMDAAGNKTVKEVNFQLSKNKSVVVMYIIVVAFLISTSLFLYHKKRKCLF